MIRQTGRGLRDDGYHDVNVAQSRILSQSELAGIY